MTNDNALASVLWLVAGGAAGYAAGRLVVAPLLAKGPRPVTASSTTATGSTALPVPKPRALGAGPSGLTRPTDPYVPAPNYIGPVHTGPSGDMRPIDPYAPPSGPETVRPVTAPDNPSAIVMPTPSLIGPVTKPSHVESATPSGPITSPSQLDARSTSGPITSPSQVDARSPSGPITSPSQLDARSPSGPITSPSQVDARSPSSPTTSPSPIGVRPSGPITSPAQVDATRADTPTVSPSPPPIVESAPTVRRPGVAFATSERVRRFDPVFDRYRGSIPIEYVRALVERESEGRPDARNGEALGLMQIRPVVLADYNKRHGTSYESSHLGDAATNVAIGCELLRLIIDSYRRNHPKIRSLQVDWNSLRFVELLTFGWNAGFSEAGGVGRVASYLELLSAVDTNIAQVSTFAEHAGASKHLSNPARVAWCKTVAALYQRERALAGNT